MAQLGEAKILASRSPEGVFINSIFYPVGGTVHPALGIVIESVDTSANQSIVKITDAQGNQYEYNAN